MEAATEAQPRRRIRRGNESSSKESFKITNKDSSNCT
jgi:hypothetical protein